MHYVVTIDRDEWLNTRKWEVWKKQWWIDRFKPGRRLGRTLFVVDREKNTCRPLFELPQKMEPKTYKALWRNQDMAAKAFSRGLRSFTQTKAGTCVINDMFGVYETTPTGEVLRYLSLPIFTDLHSALPNADNTRILVTCTGLEEVQEVGWDGTIYRRIAMHKVFGTARAPEVIEVEKRYPDHRLIPINARREFYHVNWAEWIEEGRRMLVSLCLPGAVAILKFTGREECSVERQWTYYPKCHAPTLDFKRGTFLVASSHTNQALEVDMETGEPVWVAENILFGKEVDIVDEKRAIAGDCNGRRLVEIDRNTGAELWSFNLPGIPYDVEVLRQ